MHSSEFADVSLDSAWLFELLFGNTASVCWAAAGALPTGYDRVDEFAILPAAPGRTFVVSLGSRLGTASVLSSYNSLRSGRARLARRAVGLALRTGLAQPLLRDRVDIGVASGATQDQLAEEYLGQHVQQLFGRGPVVMAIGSGREGPYRKPVLQVFTRTGEPLGFIKVGWNDWTRDAVRRESAALRACANRPMALGVPPVLAVTSWRGLELLVTGPLPRDIRRMTTGAEPDPAVLREISELSPVATSELAASSWWASVRSRIAAFGADPAFRSALEQTTDRVEREHGHVPLDFGAWHGDLVPWNLGRSGARPYAWDWESSTLDVPLGLDAVHFYFSIAFIAQLRPLAEAVEIAARGADGALGELGIPRPARRLVATLHLIELAVRHEEARHATGETDARFYPAVTAVLERTLTPSRGMAGPQPSGRAA